MIDFLKNLLTLSKYSVVKESKDIFELSYPGILLKNDSEEVTEFILIVKIHELSKLTDESQLVRKFYSSLKHLEKDFLGISKNTSLLVCWEIDSDEELKETQKIIHEIEEDPYQLKKYVLWYKRGELSELQSEIGNFTISKIYSILSDADQFSKFKNSPSVFSTYSLLSRIFIKIPALQIEINSEDLYDLQEEIKQRLKRQSWLILKNLY